MKDRVLDFFKDNIDSLSPSGGGGSTYKHPPFELTPRDFIAFAEKDLEGEIEQYKLVNSTSNLKRAVDCQLDILLVLFNLDDLYRKKRLGVDRKLGFLSQAGIFSARSLEKLNKIRNRLEHHYEMPNIHDVDVYFDLVAAFVSIGESYISMIVSNSEIELEHSAFEDWSRGVFSTLTLDKPKISLNLGGKEDENTFTVDLNSSSKPTVEDIEDFAFLLKVHGLLNYFSNNLVTPNRFIAELQKEI